MSAYSIKDLEKLSGIKAHTIRIWEKRYSLIEPVRTGTNRRLYSDSELRKIINVGVLTRNGIKISHVARLSDPEIDEKVAYLLTGNRLSDSHIDGLIIAMMDLDEQSLNSILLRSIMNNGFEVTLETLVFPFLRRIGLLWQTGSVNPAQEHFITNILRQKIITAIDSLSVPLSASVKRVMLFLPDNELHELGLLYWAYLVKKRGHNMIYLGQMMPVDSLSDINNSWRPDIIITGTISRSTDSTPAEYVKELSKIFKGKLVLVSGLLAEAAEKKRYVNVVAVRSSGELINYMGGVTSLD